MKHLDENSLVDKVWEFGKRNILDDNQYNIDQKNLRSLRKKAADLGLTRIEIPKNQGGLGFNFKTRSKIFGILSTFDFGFSMSIVNTHSAALRLSQSASPQIIDYFFPKIHEDGESACTAMSEKDFGSDFFSIETTAVKNKNDWKINGQKEWIVNARHAKLAIVFVQTKSAGDKNGIAGFAVDLNDANAKRFEINSSYSQNSMGTGGFVLKNYTAKSDDMILPPGVAYKAILNEINLARVYVGSMCCHMLQHLLEITKDYGNKRASFGKKLFTHQSWRFAIADAEVDLTAAKLMVEEAEKQVAEQKDSQLSAAKAKIFATNVCQKHFPILLHKMGAAGFHSQYPFSQYIPAVQMASLMDGSTEMLLERVSRQS
ncbi:MAG: acyl-CoA dehydrogenase [Rhodobacteraceae bacterium]|jgi:alkylation response protein AidB-like acyl-CoA dehydrogenase|nr:MAG: acyl-CoA dehydrogenase [Paracoccaceae bacterium]